MTNLVSLIIFISGVSGAGKTTLLNKIAKTLTAESVACLHFDDIGVPSLDDMTAHYGGPSQWQKAMTERWVDIMLTKYKNYKLILIEGQVNLSFIQEAFKKHNFNTYRIVLIHASHEIRHKRLMINRGQTELINIDMDNWADFLKEQAHAMNVPILDSEAMSISEMTQALMYMVENKT